MNGEKVFVVNVFERFTGEFDWAEVYLTFDEANEAKDLIEGEGDLTTTVSEVVVGKCEVG